VQILGYAVSKSAYEKDERLEAVERYVLVKSAMMPLVAPVKAEY